MSVRAHAAHPSLLMADGWCQLCDMPQPHIAIRRPCPMPVRYLWEGEQGAFRFRCEDP